MSWLSEREQQSVRDSGRVEYFSNEHGFLVESGPVYKACHRIRFCGKRSSRRPPRALTTCLLHQDHVWITADQLIRFHKNKLDEMLCKLDSTENPPSLEKYPTWPLVCRRVYECCLYCQLSGSLSRHSWRSSIFYENWYWISHEIWAFRTLSKAIWPSCTYLWLFAVDNTATHTSMMLELDAADARCRCNTQIMLQHQATATRCRCNT